jgi:hypothetical protein
VDPSTKAPCTKTTFLAAAPLTMAISFHEVHTRDWAERTACASSTVPT